MLCHASDPATWDLKMQAYPAILIIGSNKYLFYNGNGFGKREFSFAIWE